ncbi:MAG TPA: Ig-like domain-containing protein [Actinomycetales bacterium]|nr:Ig-like domain-containing protein [Actinomycetales bacterium]
MSQLRNVTWRSVAEVLLASLSSFALVLAMAVNAPSATAATTPVVFVGGSSGSAAARAALVLERPVGVVAGDVLVASVLVRGWSGDYAAPSGWQRVLDDQKSTTLHLSTYVKVAGSSEPATYSWGLSSGYDSSGVLVASSGVDPVAPVAAAAGAKGGGSTSVVAPSVTSVRDGSVVVGAFGIAVATTLTPPSDMTGRGSASWSIGSQTNSLALADKVMASAGASGSMTAVAGAAADSVGHSVVLSPASGSGNTAPVAGADRVSGVEDTAVSVPVSTLLANDFPGAAGSGESGQTLTVTGVAPAAGDLGSVVLSGGQVVYTPGRDVNGTAGFQYTVCDDGSPVRCSTGQVTVTLAAVNDAPSFTKGANQSVLAGSGAVSVPGWATGISAGPADESGQVVTFAVTGNTNPAVFSVAPVVSSSGTLTFTPSTTTGTSTVSVVARDDGGTANGGKDTSAAQPFTVTVSSTPPPTPPTASPDSYTATSGTALVVPAATGVLANDSRGSGGALTATLVSTVSHGTLSLAADGSFTYTPTSGYTGSDAFTYTAKNDAGTSATTTATITVTSAPGTGGKVVGFWRMEETSGTTAFDSSGNGNNGANRNIALGQPGYAGLGYGFNGSSSVVTIPHSSSLTPGSQDYRVDVAIKTTNPMDVDIVRKGLGTTTGGEWKIEMFSQQASCVAKDNTGFRSDVGGGPILTDGKWHTISCIKTADSLRLVVDGMSFWQYRRLGTMNNTAEMTIGSRSDTTDQVDGVIDEVKYTIG